MRAGEVPCQSMSLGEKRYSVMRCPSPSFAFFEAADSALLSSDRRSLLRNQWRTLRGSCDAFVFLSAWVSSSIGVCASISLARLVEGCRSASSWLELRSCFDMAVLLLLLLKRRQADGLER